MMRQLSILLIPLLFTGCVGSGYEIGGRLGLYRVDKRDESQSTSSSAPVMPLICAFTDCTNQGEGNDK